MPGRRLRTLLSRLATDVGRPVPARTLIDALWPDEAPGDPANALQSLVSRLRRTLGDPGLVEQLPGGYRLGVKPDDVDAVRFARLAATGRAQLVAGSCAEASETLCEALALWRGDPLPDDESVEADGVRARLARAAAAGQGRPDRGRPQRPSPWGPGRPRRHHRRARAARRRAPVARGPHRAADARAGLARPAGGGAGRVREHPHLPGRHPGQRPVPRAARAAPGGAAGPGRRPGESPDQPAGRGHQLRRTRRGRSAGPTRCWPARAGWSPSSGPAAPARPGSPPRSRPAGSAGTADGVWFVELAPVGEADNVALAVLDGLGARELTADPLERAERPVRETHERILAALADSDALVVIDNCEHVVEAAATVVADILGHCPDVRLIATSREPLGIDGEALYPLTPLRLPEVGATAEQAGGSAAVRLLLDRARAAGAALVLDDDTVADVVEVVRRLDGLPLAIELAAARLRAMPVGGADPAPRRPLPAAHRRSAHGHASSPHPAGRRRVELGPALRRGARGGRALLGLRLGSQHGGRHSPVPGDRAGGGGGSCCSPWSTNPCWCPSQAASRRGSGCSRRCASTAPSSSPSRARSSK